MLLIALLLFLAGLPWVYPPSAFPASKQDPTPIARFACKPQRSARSPVTSARRPDFITRLKTYCAQQRIRQREKHLYLDPAVVLDLAGAGIKTGSSIPRVLHCLAHACQCPELSQIAQALLWGLPWKQAWQIGQTSSQQPAWFAPLQTALEPAWADGVAPEKLLRGQAQALSNEKDQRAKEAAQKLAVKLVLPLGVCQLPAFILLGILPNILGGINLL